MRNFRGVIVVINGHHQVLNEAYPNIFYIKLYKQQCNGLEFYAYLHMEMRNVIIFFLNKYIKNFSVPQKVYFFSDNHKWPNI